MPVMRCNLPASQAAAPNASALSTALMDSSRGQFSCSSRLAQLSSRGQLSSLGQLSWTAQLSRKALRTALGRTALDSSASSRTQLSRGQLSVSRTANAGSSPLAGSSHAYSSRAQPSRTALLHTALSSALSCGLRTALSWSRAAQRTAFLRNSVYVFMLFCGYHSEVSCIPIVI